MDLSRLIAELSKPGAYPFEARKVEVRQTHISAVFLAGGFAYKVKKPVDFGFLDFSTLEKRRHYCEEEVRLNRRLAPDVYLGVVPMVEKNGRLLFEGEGEPLEWAVKMRRLPDEATLLYQVEQGTAAEETARALARRLAKFHEKAERGPQVSSWARFDGVARNLRGNFEASGKQLGVTVDPGVFDHLVRLTEQALFRNKDLINARADRNVPRDCHGDLHLDHVYLFPEEAPPGDLVIVDCIEFTERFRFIDPVSDLSFLRMEFLFYGRPDLAAALVEEFFASSKDEEGRALLPLYTGYRACVRAKVEGLELLEREIPEEERARAMSRARAHWLLALGQLEAPARRPALLLVGGLPGTGKTTLARELSRTAGFEVIRSDVIRKELAGLGPLETRADLYTPGWTRKTYGECLARAKAALFKGKRVLVDANFRAEAQRREFLETAKAWCVPALFFECTAPREIIKERLSGREKDASDATWEVYEKLEREWAPPGKETAKAARRIGMGGSVEEAAAAAAGILGEAGLL